MEPININEILLATKGKLLSKGRENFICHVHIDSRQVKKSSLFIPIIGKRVDGHKFIKECFKSGAIAALTSKEINFKGKTVIKVEDTCKALMNLAKFYRKKFVIPIIGITGSVGKTTTKEIIASALSFKLEVMKTKGNLNSKIGLPLTIFNLEKKHQVAIVELGISEIGEMKELSRIVKPDFAIITNIGVSHIQNFKNKKVIMNEKLHICDFLKSDLFLNGDDKLLKTYKNAIFFGFNKKNDLIAKNIRTSRNKTVFNVKNEEIIINVPGIHNIYSALAAICVGEKLKLSLQDIKKGLLKYRGTDMRQKIYRLNSLTIIDDTYNSSPDSVISAINTMEQISKNSRKIVILADMLELGKSSDKIHENLGKELSKSNVDILITVGKKAKNIIKGITKLSCIKHSVNINKEAIFLLKNLIRKNDIILIKGSRGMKMEEIVDEVKNYK